MVRTAWPLFLLLPFALAACSSAAQGSDEETSGGAGTPAAPPIHVQQTLVDRKDGQVPLERLYQEALASCRKGNLAVKPLDADTVRKLGRTYLETWYEGDRMAVREERWSYDVDRLCVFKPIRERSLSIADAHGSQRIDLDRHTGQSYPDVPMRHAIPEQTRDPDDDLKAAVAAQLQQQGQADLMVQDAGKGTEAGQPCKRVQSEMVDLCIWTGGARWGFDATVGNGPYSTPQFDSIVLSAEPADGGDGQYLSTQKMTVGQPFDPGVFRRPSGIAMDQAP